jgi:DNA invertase Pin-like site-specific DNA recombinase
MLKRAAIKAEAERRGWVVTIIEDAAYSAKDMKRPGIQAVLGSLRSGAADALCVSRLDRLSRSMLDFAGLMATAQREGWSIVALDLGVDTTTPEGEMMAHVRATFAQYERRLISQRTREALAQRRAAGVRLGRERLVAPEVEARARALRAAGLTQRAVGAALAAEGHRWPSGRRGAWHPSTLHRIAQPRVGLPPPCRQPAAAVGARPDLAVAVRDDAPAGTVRVELERPATEPARTVAAADVLGSVAHASDASAPSEPDGAVLLGSRATSLRRLRR